MVSGLRQRALSVARCQYRGLETATGSPHLDAARLGDHSLRFLDLSPDLAPALGWRDTHTAVSGVRRQYWLYGRTSRVLHLLRAETVASQSKRGEWKVQQGERPWRDVDATARKRFLSPLSKLYSGRKHGR